MASIDPTSRVASQVKLGEGVEIGPWCVLDGPIQIGPGTRLLSNVILRGPLTIGSNCLFYPGAAIGYPGQDFKFKFDNPTPGVVIGDNCTFREGVTIHAATHKEIPTRVGNNCYFMVQSHAGHDCQIGNHVTIVNAAVLGGHCEIADNVTIGGLAAIHQFTRIGRYAFVSGHSGFTTDIPPFCMAYGRNRLQSINQVGLRRANFPREQIQKLRTVFRRALQSAVTRQDAIAICESFAAECPPAQEIADFMRAGKRPIAPGSLRPPKELTAFLQARRRGEHIWGMESEEPAV
ncbi:MAG: acyl-ACP--UDP-N-acetylglucosamine O-acyltransferase [Phycisphaerales bacterium]|nr:acyl-ACP--UDP-N-acetylglucosamine O-acyltransferase [Planctomycetota bacterium]